MKSLRGLPRLFLPGASAEGEFELPEDELKKLRNVLRLSSGASIAVLPNDGSLIECQLQGRRAVPIRVHHPATETTASVVIAQALPKGDKLDHIVKACTGLGVTGFVVFPSDRTVVQWDARKLDDKLRRLRAVAREEAEVSFRTRIPTVDYAASLTDLLSRTPAAVVLSEGEDVSASLALSGATATLVIGPEGGWSPREVELIGDRAVTLGPRVLRVEFAGPAAAAKLLLP